MWNKKRIVGLLLLLVVVFSVGCKGKENDVKEETTETEVTEEATEVAKEPTSLFVSRWAGPHADTQKEIIKDYTDSMVTIDDVDYGNLKQKQILSFQSRPGDGNYDVVWVNYFWMKEYVENGYLLPIDDYIKENGLDTSMYSKSMMESCIFDSKTYGLPTFAQTLILTYDSVALENAGLEVPKTTDDLIAVA
ncbi:ABC transporter substrate-binding protein, partial [Petrocella sp. FN5]|uniref:ABC transporter substrate-binding protein n=1 Tax=Petrocella sp. FN5 TaxID=3032002 RepID=UPI0023DB638F